MSDWRPHYRPSNGTDGDLFKLGPQGCYSCTVDHHEGWHDGDDTGESCPILMEAMLGDVGPAQWEERDRSDGKGWDVRCTAWEGPCSCTEGTTYRTADWESTT